MASRPTQPFAPAGVVTPRMWFVLLWGAGIGVVVFLNIIEPSEAAEQILMLLVATPLMVVRRPVDFALAQRAARAPVAAQRGPAGGAVGSLVDGACGPECGG